MSVEKDVQNAPGSGLPRPGAGRKTLVGLSGGIAGLIGATYAICWLLGLPSQWAATGIITMKTNLALSLVLAGGALLVLDRAAFARRGRAAAGVAASLVLLVGGLTLLEHLLRLDLGIDQLLAREPPGAAATAAPNRMGPPAAVSLVLIGAGLLAFVFRRHQLSRALGLVSCCVVLVPAVGYLYGIGDLYASPHLTAIAWPSVIGLFGLGFGLAVAGPADAQVPLPWRDDPGGVLLRRMLLPAVALPLGLGFLRLQGERLGLYGRPVGTGLLAIALIIIFIALLWRSGSELSAAAAARGRAEQQARWRASLLDLANDAVFVWSRPEGIETWNLGAERLYGFRADEALGKMPGDLLKTELPCPRAEMEGQLERLGRWEGEIRHRTRSDKPVIVWSKLQSVHGGDGRTLVLESNRDVTEIRRAMEHLAQEKARLAVTLESIGDAVIATDEKRRVTVFNRVAERLCGASADAALGDGLDEVFRVVDEGTGQPADLLEPVFREGVARALAESVVLVAKDGRGRPIATSAAPIRDANGRVAGAVLVFRDQTAERQAERALQEAVQSLKEADRRKDEFLAVLSHELRNPLAPIHNALSVLRLAPPESDPAQRAQQVIERQVEHMTRLVDDLLDVSRLARGKIEFLRAPLDLGPLAGRVAEDHRSLFERKGVRLDLEVEGDPLPIEGDAVRLAQVIGNLLQNAAKFTPEGGRVVLETAREGHLATIRVRDTGIGLEPGFEERLFEPFVQGAQGLERSRGGLGLGLALVKALVEAHGGVVFAASEGPGRGLEVTARLPLAEAAAWTAPAPTTQVSAGKRRVLVIEDNVDGANSLRELLELEGHVAEVAYDGASGFQKARSFQPEVVLCDIGLPGMDGYAVARAVRAEPWSRGVVLVALTGYAQPKDREKAREAGFDAHVAKPPSMEEIRAAMSARCATA